MSITATSLKLPRRLKSRVERLARRSGESAHAFMVRALESQVEAEERYQAFLEEGLRADEAMQKSGLGYEADAAHAYLESRASLSSSSKRLRTPRSKRLGRFAAR